MQEGNKNFIKLLFLSLAPGIEITAFYKENSCLKSLMTLMNAQVEVAVRQSIIANIAGNIEVVQDNYVQLSNGA